MLTSTWLPVLFTLLAALGISYFLGFIPGAKSPVTAAAAVATTTTVDVDTHAGLNAEGESTHTQNGTPQAEVVIDKRLPPVQHQCLACDKKTEQLGKPLLRCSQCKNAFYCVCQPYYDLIPPFFVLTIINSFLFPQNRMKHAKRRNGNDTNSTVRCSRLKDLNQHIYPLRRVSLRRFGVWMKFLRCGWIRSAR